MAEDIKRRVKGNCREGVCMDEARKKLRLWLLAVVAAAVIVGLIYYFLDGKSGDMSEGTLVRIEGLKEVGPSECYAKEHEEPPVMERTR